MKINISERMADELRQWVSDERDSWPADTAYQRDLADLAKQLDAGLPSVADVRGILAAPPPRPHSQNQDKHEAPQEGR